jgi:hypothetical protein
MLWRAALFTALFAVAPAFAQAPVNTEQKVGVCDPTVSPNPGNCLKPNSAGAIDAIGSYFVNAPSTVLTRASNSTTYTANTTWCPFASTTVCAPITVAIANTVAGNGFINRVTLVKSGATTTNADFVIWFFSATPGVAAPAQYDDVAYAGPRIADMPNYIGSATCATPTATSDSSPGVWYECSLNNPNTAGALAFQALSGVTTIDALISVTAAYAPASAETLTAYLSGFY